ncbi:putative wall-associated receptor kinase, galacturonan-binding domain-containing protein [Heracleum sosnowskyi]|uniref:non-specific serine/threonine protein kinase n=1 Tax=Heracleum sosnowskyi TaxID=360622 RepID=A0AAD8JIA7_9APIA|nr:putative wall-associated receptor kinase, galacturonan-binding domain-containing protein [Heracleum sosnowskyi]
MTISQKLYLLFLFSSIFVNCNGQDPCPSRECNGVEIKYPFWRIDEGATSVQFCGYPGFGLNCSDTTQDPVLTLPKDSYFVHDINYDNYTLNLIDIDVIDVTCPRVRHNFTVETLPLYQTSSDLNLTFYFNCSDPPPPTLPTSPINCLASEQKKSYVVEALIEAIQFDRWFEVCEDKVDIAVKKREIERNNINGLISEFRRALNDGFSLYWKTLKECEKCEESDGRCGFNNIAKEYLCFCEDNTIRRNNQSCRETYTLLRNQQMGCYGEVGLCD